MTTTPPGWYDAGDGTTRWWDGTAWTAVAAPPQPENALDAHGPSPSSNDETFAVIAHVGPLIGLSFVAPLIIFLIVKDDASRSKWVRDHAREALNFQISLIIYFIGAFIALFALAILTFGLALFVLVPLMLAAGFASLIVSIIAAVAAGRGETYRYPLTIRFIS